MQSPTGRDSPIGWRPSSIVALILSSSLVMVIGSCSRSEVERFYDHPVTVETEPTFQRLVQEEDLDNDKKITANDFRMRGKDGEGRAFFFTDVNGKKYSLKGVYYLSNLLQELAIAKRQKVPRVDIEPRRIFEPPTQRISRLIRERYWAGLTRRIDLDHLKSILGDQKTDNQQTRDFFMVLGKGASRDEITKVVQQRANFHFHILTLPPEDTVASVRLLFETATKGMADSDIALRYLYVPQNRPGLLKSLDKLWWAASNRPESRLRIAPLPARIQPSMFSCLEAHSSSPDGGEGGRVKYLYVPHEDDVAYKYYKNASSEKDSNWKVSLLPKSVSADYVKSLAGRHGLLSLALADQNGVLTINPSNDDKRELERADSRLVGVPFVVPGGRFNEMYGWDSYFETLGLLPDGRLDLARAMVDNLVYEVNNYGRILNANRTYYLTRSQPPFLTSIALEVYRYLPKGAPAHDWLARTLRAAMDEYENVWSKRPHLDRETGLSRYFGFGRGQPPEVEPGHFDSMYEHLGEEVGLIGPELECRYLNSWELKGSLRKKIDEYFVQDRCMRESGHDTTYRWDVDGNRCADFVTVDLNALLYKYEVDLASAIEEEFNGLLTDSRGRPRTSEEWRRRSERRKMLIRKYLWDSKRHMFFDYDLARSERRTYVSATSLYPLWAWNPSDPNTSILSPEETGALIAQAIGMLEAPGGIVASTEASRGPLSPTRRARQWDYPNGWAPHQMLIWSGLSSHGRDHLAGDLAYRWLYTITGNAVCYNGTIPEKLDVEARSHEVFAEYGNVGTKFAYITEEGFGWMNASYKVGLSMITTEQRAHLDDPAELERVFCPRDY